MNFKIENHISMKKYIVLLLTVVVFGSCVVYHPHNVDIPLLSERGQLHVDGSVSMSAPLLVAPALNATVAWAPLDMFGVQASASVTDFKNCYFQAAGGTYFPFGNAVLECYLGYGHGLSYDDSVGDLNHHHYTVDGSYNRVFSQINFGWAGLDDGGIDVGMGLKGGLLTPKWDKIERLSDGTETLAERHDQVHFLLQPQLMFRFGWQKVKFSVNVAYAFLTDWPTENNYFNYERFSAGLGMHLMF